MSKESEPVFEELRPGFFADAIIMHGGSIVGKQKYASMELDFDAQE